MLVKALDAEKAFDLLETGYLIHLLENMNFGPSFLRMIKAMYNRLQAQIVVNDLRTND